MTHAATPSLYERLGGIYGIAGAVDRLRASVERHRVVSDARGDPALVS